MIAVRLAERAPDRRRAGLDGAEVDPLAAERGPDGEYGDVAVADRLLDAAGHP